MKETIAFCVPSHLPNSGGGWGNGYVAIPEGHPYFGRGTFDDSFDMDVNGGLTFAKLINEKEERDEDSPFKPYEGMWVIGFDTLHSWDSLDTWPNEESVMKEALSLKAQVDDVQGQINFLQGEWLTHQQAANKFQEMIDKVRARVISPLDGEAWDAQHG